MNQSPSSIKVVLLVIAATLLGGFLFAQEKAKSAPSLSDAAPAEVTSQAEVNEPAAAKKPTTTPAPEASASAPEEETVTKPAPKRKVTRLAILSSLWVFVLAVFLGFEVITKVPPTLHTPLMSGSNAISGITLVGAVIVSAAFTFSGFVGFLAVLLATINAVGGFLVTHRMLAMFKKR